MVVAPLRQSGEEVGERVLAGVPPRAVPAVVPERDRLGQRHRQPAGAGHAAGDLGHLQGVGEPGPLVVRREDEDLGLAGEPPERSRVQHPVPVPLEAGPLPVGLLLAHPPARPPRPRRTRDEQPLLELLPLPPPARRPAAGERPGRRGVRGDDASLPRRAGHGRGPAAGPLRLHPARLPARYDGTPRPAPPLPRLPARSPAPLSAPAPAPRPTSP